MPEFDNKPSVLTWSCGDAEKKLIALSSAIILFDLTGGSIPDQQLKLPLINLRFEDTQNIVYIVFFLLLWYWYRHLQTNKKSEHIIAINNEIFADRTMTKLEKIYADKHNMYTHVEGIYFDVDQHSFKPSIRFNQRKDFDIKDDYKDFNDVSGRLLIGLRILKAILLKPSFARYVTPYALFTAAFTCMLFIILEPTLYNLINQTDYSKPY